jgi:uncharacterized protein (DUF1499 family)
VKTLLITIFVLIVAVILLLSIFSRVSKQGGAAGLVEGALSKCAKTPNCVCSEHSDDVDHYVEPIIIPRNVTVDALSLLREAIEESGGHVESEAKNYLAATFTSSIFRFVDDLEIRLDSAQQLIHIRSASRVGYSDMGVNRNRVGLLKRLFDEKIAEAN